MVTEPSTRNSPSSPFAIGEPSQLASLIRPTSAGGASGASGSVRVGDTVWRARSDESFKVGSYGKIADVDGATVVLVKPEDA